MKRTAIAEKLGVSVSTVNKYLDGSRKPKWETAERLKPFTGKNFEWWRRATAEQIQKLFDRILRANHV